MKETCHKCNRSTYLAIQCRCGFMFCTKHKNPHQHDCKYNFRDVKRKELENKIPKTESGKITKIEDV